MPVSEASLEDGLALHGAGKNLFADIRAPGHYAAGHVPGAVPLSDATIETFVRDTPKDTPIVVYCYHGISSRGAAAYLNEQGFQDVKSLQGGFEGWRGRQFPIEQ